MTRRTPRPPLRTPAREAELATLWPSRRGRGRIPLPDRREWRWPRGRQSGSKMRQPRIDPLRRALTMAELSALCRPITCRPRRARTPTQQRTLAAIALLAGTGLPLGDLPRLLMRDLPRLAMPSWAWGHLATYLAHPDRPQGPAALPTASGRPASRHDLALHIARLAAQAEVPAGARTLRLTARAGVIGPARHLRPAGAAADRIVLAAVSRSA